MPDYLVTDPATGQRIKMSGPAPPSEALIRLALAKVQPLPSHAPTQLQTADPLQAMQKAQTIGPARVGERYQEDLNPSLVGIARKVLGGAQRPASVAAEDPYGIGAWLKGAGPMPTPIAAEIRAYHGSPHDFEKFLLEKIGTGEGAQAYGHGLYFAENPAVAHEYRKTLTNLTDEESRTILDVLPKQFQGPDNVRRILADIHDSMAKGEIQKPSQFAKDYQVAPPLQQAYEKAGAILDNKGKTYHVSIKADPDQFLDWDKPLSQQSEQVKALAETVKPQLRARLKLYASNPAATGPQALEDITGKDIYDALVQKHKENQLKATDTARQAGIPGIKYLDQGSRNVQVIPPDQNVHGQWLTKVVPNGQRLYLGPSEEAARKAAEGSHNYVVFDDKLIDILKKYAVAGAVGGSLASLGQPQTEEQK